MTIEIRCAVDAADDVVTERIRRKFERALKHHKDTIRNVVVTATDTNGPKGGADKLCRVIVVPFRGDEIVLEQRDAHLGAAMAKLAERTTGSLERALGVRHAHDSIRHANRWIELW